MSFLRSLGRGLTGFIEASTSLSTREGCLSSALRGFSSKAAPAAATASSSAPSAAPANLSGALPPEVPAPSFVLKGNPLLSRKRASRVPDLHSPNAHVPQTIRKKIDVERREIVAQYELYRNSLRALMRCESLAPELRFVLSTKLHSLPLNTSPLRVTTRCIINKRPRGVYSFFRINRVSLKLRMMRGQVPGMGRATWGSYGQQLHKKWRSATF